MKIFTVTPKPFFQNWMTDSFFFTRDMGLTCLALREQGIESRVVLLKGPTTKEHPDIFRTTIEDMECAEWWKQHHLNAVVLGAWADPKYTPVARAIKESGAKLIIRCDSGSPYSQRQKSPRDALYSNYLGPRYRGKGAAYAALSSVVRTLIGYIPALYEKKVIEHMAYADLIMNETPEGVRLLKELLCRYGRMDIAARVKYVPHPVAGDMGYSAETEKQNRIVAVGRWENYQKNGPLLIQALARVLTAHPEYEAHIFGGGDDLLKQLLLQTPAAVQSQIHIRGTVPNQKLAREYQKSQIIFMPSRSEGSSVAAEEALSCGCSVVGSAHVLCMKNFVSKNSGTLARRYSVQGMAEALETEIAAWGDGLRNPSGFAEQWKNEVSRSTVAQTVIAAATGLPKEKSLAS